MRSNAGLTTQQQTSFLLQLIDSEILTVVSFMRRNAKFLNVSQNLSLAFALLESPIPQGVSLNHGSAVSYEDLLARRLVLFRWAANPSDHQQHSLEQKNLLSSKEILQLNNQSHADVQHVEMNVLPRMPQDTTTVPNTILGNLETPLLLCEDVKQSVQETRATSTSPSLPAISASPAVSSTSPSVSSSGQQARLPQEQNSVALPGNVLIQGFEELQKRLATVDPHRPLSEQVSRLFLLTPFLRIVQSGDATGPIAGAAIASIEKLIVLGVIGPEHDNVETLPQLLSMIVQTVTHAKFEATDTVSDETVLWRILSLLRSLFISPLHCYLTDEAVCQMFEMGIGMWMMRLSELLRKSTEQILTLITRRLFARVNELDAEEHGSTLSKRQNHRGGKSSISLPPSPILHTLNSTHTDNQPESNSALALSEMPRPRSANAWSENISSKPPVFTQYGLPSIMELLRVLISIIDMGLPTPHSDTSRVLALHLLQAAIETAGHALDAFPQVVELLAEQVMKHLLSIVRVHPPAGSASVLSLGVGIGAIGNGNMSINVVVMAYRVILLLWQTLHESLKCQLEMILDHIMEKWSYWNGTTLIQSVASTSPERTDSSASAQSYSPSITPERYTPTASRRPMLARWEVREAFLELFVEIMKTPNFFTMLYVNYDCNIYTPYLFEQTIRFLAANVCIDDLNPNSTVLYRHCFEAILVFLKEMGSLHKEGHSPNISIDLETRHAQKMILLEGATKFNANVKEGIKFLQGHGMLPMEENPKAMASFLKSTPNLNKKIMGEYLARPSNIAILKEFIRLYHFGTKRIDEALRELLESFRLPGESQQIDRIVECFAEVYVWTKPAHIASQDAAYILAFAIILLNTDQHNPQVRYRMTIDSFKRNLKGTNTDPGDKKEKNFPSEFLQEIYDSVKANEIVMPAEQEGELGFNYQWKQLMMRARTHGNRIDRRASASCHRNMFLSVWGQIVSALSIVFDACGDKEALLLKSVEGLHHCSQLSHLHRLPEVIDNIVISLSNVSGLLEDVKEASEYPADVRNADNNEEQALPKAIELGQNVKAQLATVMMFNMSLENVNEIRDGWSNVLGCLRTLFLHNILPKTLLEMVLSSGNTHIILRMLRQSQSGVQQRASASLFSFFSYLATATAGEGRIGALLTREERELQEIASRCIEECHLAQLVEGRNFETTEPLMCIFKTLLNFCMEQGSVRTPRADMSIAALAEVKRFDPAAPLFVHMLYRFASQNITSINSIWPALHELTAEVISCNTVPAVLLKQTLIEGLMLCLHTELPFTLVEQAVVTFGAVVKQPNESFLQLGDTLITGLDQLLKTRASALFNTDKCRESVVSIIQTTYTAFESLRPSCIECMSVVVSEHVEAKRIVTPEFHKRLVDTLQTLLMGTQQERATSPVNDGQSSISKSGPVDTKLHAKTNAFRSLDMLFALRQPLLAGRAQSDGDKFVEWNTYWMPLLLAFTKQALHPARDICQQSLSLMQRLVLQVASTTALSETNSVTSLFENVFLPLVDRLLNGGDQSSVAISVKRTGNTTYPIDETKAQAVSILCKNFLHFMHLLSAEHLMKLWTQILDLFTKFIQTKRVGVVREAMSESLKNMILVMCAANVLEPLSNQVSESKRTLWTVTWEQINICLPQLRDELFPPIPTTTNIKSSNTRPKSPSSMSPEASKSSSTPSRSRPTSPTTTTITSTSPIPVTKSEEKSEKSKRDENDDAHVIVI